ncbi:MAG: DUF2339 domain-containing protein [Candidatus Eisenbacteria bacterium]|uniref:DUF2339 domain-containing protein n=1 Tax=Eiseniibacteriota bacterium TaxID=2212470 RepID=A0A849SLM0_UNCEI|nr:DUF2339 domain-containing protein [Candidatus Eisenbacteria bacterium]
MVWILILPALVIAISMLATISSRTRLLERELEWLRRRVDELERAPRTRPVGLEPAVTPAVEPEVVDSATVEPEVPPVAFSAATPEVPRRTRDMEQLVGGVWLQNVGAVLVLIGFFFLILWGYTTGRFGPQVVVIAGMLAGLAMVWRGDRMQRRMKGLGHALVGVGAGFVWLSIYLGHFTLHVIPAPFAFPLMLIASVFTGMLGLRYGVESIAALGVVGAFLPHALQALVPLYGFSLPPGALLGYLAVLDALVFTLAARAGWSSLAFTSLLLTAITWITAVPAQHWSWPLEIGLAGLFAGLGIAPIPRLARLEGTVRPIDLAVIVTAPLALLAVSAPMFEHARPIHVAMLLLAIAGLYVFVAAWVDSRRPERDLWRPLTGAATLFATAAIERAAGPTYTPLAWIVFGVTLELLGLSPRSRWLRWCGHVVVVLGAARLVSGWFDSTWSVHPLPIANAHAIRDGLAIAALLFGAHRIARARETLEPAERALAEFRFAGAHVLLAIGLAREAHHLAWALERASGTWRAMPDLRAPGSDARYWSLLLSALGLAWLLQAAWLVRTGVRQGRPIARGLGHAVAILVAAVLTARLLEGDSWGLDLAPLVHRDALLGLAAIVLAFTVAARLTRNRSALGGFDRRAAELWAALASVVLLAWIAHEADHLARTLMNVPGRMSPQWFRVEGDVRQRVEAFAATLTSVGWLLQAIAAFVVGWKRRSAFLRWVALALVAVTVLKFLIVDLRHADPLWRFLTAIVAGAAMLGLSYVYQRRGRSLTDSRRTP